MPAGGGNGCSDTELDTWTMNGTGGSVAYFIMDGGIKVTVQGKQVKLRELARADTN